MIKWLNKLLTLIAIGMACSILFACGSATAIVIFGHINPRFLSIPMILAFDFAVVGGMLHGFLKGANGP